MRDPGDLARELAKIGDAVDAATRHFAARDESNAALHMAPVRPAPLTVAVQAAAEAIARLRKELG